jgi:steroid delta-isomerase-like uncharacterized protein
MKKLYMILPLTLILCFLVGCQDKEAMAELEEFRAQVEVEEQNIALVKRFHDAWNSGDAEAIKEIFSPDLVYHRATAQDASLEQMLEWIKPQMEWYPDRIYVMEDIFAKGDKVVLRYLFKGTYEGDIEGLPPATGKKIEITGIEICRVENGKIIERWDAHDDLSLMQQLGMELKPKEGE